MAHKKRGLSDEVKECLEGADHYWGIDKGVGWGFDNDWDDVMLIQYLLNATNSAKEFPFMKSNLEQDGIFGPKTQKAIRAFQKSWAVFTDGMINAADGSDLYIHNSSGIGNTYAIYLLNYQYRYHKHAYYEDLRMDSKLPPELVSVFSSWTNADS